ncbi:MAG: hypothetical protein QOE77_3039 [Blastocatellia bacterium]|jgi:hypothetical protein|nr:hypothetical protein [Blastocatellia bacterium]
MRIVLSALLLACASTFCFAQEKSAATPIIVPVNLAISTATTEAPPALSPVPTDPFLAMRIPLNSKVYIAPFVSEDSTKPVEGFETYMAAAIRKKGVPVIMVADRSQADFAIEGSADKKGAGFAKKWLLGDFRRSTSASLTVTNLHTGVIAYADSSDRASANRGLRSSAEKLAKYLKRKMTDDEKKFARMGANPTAGK